MRGGREKEKREVEGREGKDRVWYKEREGEERKVKMGKRGKKGR